MKDRYLPGAHVDALEYVHLIRAGAFFRGVADDVDDNVVVHFLQKKHYTNVEYLVEKVKSMHDFHEKSHCLCGRQEN